MIIKPDDIFTKWIYNTEVKTRNILLKRGLE